MSDKDLSLCSLSDKGEPGSPENLRLRSVADKEGVPPPPPLVTQYLAGLDLPEFPHEKDLISDKLPCPPPYD